jgi:RNA recognition motif-containing protein
MQSPPRARQQGLRAGQQLQVQQLGGPVFYPAATPGPPIQTTQHNKGPEGANLFIFHIPNHFTNLDMWHLFCQYGNLLSVRIMVEKDTGRSRGFGFVSYDAPDAAALAIKELNGFVVGNKRLKVQHKQIRHGEMSMQHEQTSLPPPLFPHGDPVSQGAGYNMPTQEGLAVADVNLPRGLEDQQLDQNQVPNKMLNLDSLGDALPEVDK